MYSVVTCVGLDEIIKAIEESVNEVDRILEEKDRVREEVIRIVRDIVRFSGDAITSIHLGKLDEAEEIIKRVEDLISKVYELVENHPELKYSGLVNDAVAEYVEAKLLLEFVRNGKVPRYNEINVHYVPYLKGLCDFVGELKRLAIDSLRRSDIDYAYKVFNIMECVYNALRRLDYPDALTPGLRHRVDIMRRIIEDLRAFLVDMESRLKLVKALKSRESGDQSRA